VRLAFLSIGRHLHTERWISWFAERGHECHLLTVQPGEIPGVTVHDITTRHGPKPVRYALSLVAVRRLLRRLRPDLLNTHFLTGYGYWGHFSGFHPNVLTVWGDDVYVTPFENRLKNLLARRALASCDAVTGDSRDILSGCAALGAVPERCFRVLWGVDFTRFRSATAQDYRRRLGFGDDDIVFFSPRSFTQPYYNIDTVIEAAARVVATVPGARFFFAGYEGDPGPFRARAEAAGLTGVMVFGGIVSDLPSATEWIADGKSGLVVTPRDVTGLADAMKRFAGNPELRAVCGRAAGETARRDAGFDANMSHVADIFRCLTEDEVDWPVEVSLPLLSGG